MTLERLEALIAEAKKDSAITPTTEVAIRVGAAQADNALVTVREAIAFTVGEGVPALKPSVPGSVGAVGAPAALSTLAPYRQAKMLVIEGV